MADPEKRSLVLEHARLMAEHATGKGDVVGRLREIETILGMTAAQISVLAVQEYLKDY
jgi:hypothetical protein